jgi:hypothetical protein
MPIVPTFNFRRGNTQTPKSGAPKLASSNSQAAEYLIKDTLSAGNVKTYPLSMGKDATALVVSVDTSITSGTTAAAAQDALAGLAKFEVLGPSGEVMDITPSLGVPSSGFADGDFYDLSHRFSPRNVRPAAVTLTPVASSAVSATFTGIIYGISLPTAKGPYQIRLTAESLPTDATALSVTVELSFITGTAQYQSNFKPNDLGFTPAANGNSDLSPIATIQGVSLTELFFTGFTSNTADINYLTAVSKSVTIGNKLLGYQLVSSCNSVMTTALLGDELFLLLALQTQIVLGRDGDHLYVTWGSSPSSSIRIGYYWLVA